ncbi:MAG: hypothetical protein HOW71_33335 [Nonomuraea sp.]|nr:hypothetical protein [Nonomuraea sp.]
MSCWSVLPVLYAVLVLVLRAHGENTWTAIFGPIGTTLTVAMYLAVGVTGLFALADRQRSGRPGAAASLTEPWTPDRLTTADDPRPARWSDLIGDIVLVAALIAALFAQRTLSPVTTTEGAPVPIVDPALWAFWIPYFIAVIVLVLLVKAVGLRQRRWTAPTALARTALTLVGTVPLAWLFWQAQVLNHALTHDTGALPARGSWIAWLAIMVLALVTIGSLLQSWRPRNRHRAGDTDTGSLHAGPER